jgi:CrcB protein
VVQLAWVMLGGAAGSGARYLVGIAVIQRFGTTFPWGTLGINLVGSLLLGAVWSLCDAGTLSADARLALGTGVLGGFTTYSTFSAEAATLLAEGATGRAAAYVAATVLGGLAASFAGFWLGRAAVQP